MTWIQYSNRINESNDLSEKDKENYKEALEYVRENIFKAKPNDIISENHLIISNIKNLTTWSRIWLIRFKTAIYNVQNKQNCNTIINRVKHADTFRDILLEISIGDAFIEGGLI